MPIYMRIDGLVGNVTEIGHTNWIEVESFSFGCERSIPETERTKDREAEKVQVSEITVSKKMDKTMPMLFGLACAGTEKRVEIDLCQPALSPDTASQVYASYVLEQVLISSYTVSCAGSDPCPQENIRLNYTKITATHRTHDENGPTGSATFGYNLAEKVKI